MRRPSGPPPSLASLLGNCFLSKLILFDVFIVSDANARMLREAESKRLEQERADRERKAREEMQAELDREAERHPPINLPFPCHIML